MPNILGQDVSEEQYYRLRAKDYGLAPDQWQEARNLAAQGQANYNPVKMRVVYSGPSGLTISRTQTISEDAIQGIDRSKLEGMVATDPKGTIFRNEHGTFTPPLGPTSANPMGKNAVFTGKDGSVSEGKFWGYVQQGPRGTTYVPGWNTSSRLLNHPDFQRQPQGYNTFDSAYGPAWYSDLKVGTDVRPILTSQGYNLQGTSARGAQRAAVHSTPNNRGSGSGGAPSSGGGGGGLPPTMPPTQQPPAGGRPPTADPYQGNPYQGYGHPGTPYARPIFSPGSQWTHLYQDYLNRGIDVSQMGPDMAGLGPDPSGFGPPQGGGMEEPPPVDGGGGDGGVSAAPSSGYTGGDYRDYYRRYLVGGRSPGDPPLRIP